MSKIPETIPDKATLYRNIPPKHILTDDKIMPISFSRYDMSTDWDEHSTPEESLQRHDIKYQGGIVGLGVSDIKSKIQNQIIKHTPSRRNPAHTDVLGEKDNEIRLAFCRIAKWIIEP
ncbi:hypothetical protein ACFL57_05415 [Candidatus Margulisiibacteriota bacterium]